MRVTQNGITSPLFDSTVAKNRRLSLQQAGRPFMRYVQVVFASFLIFLAACTSTRTAAPAATPSMNRTLTVMLYPYIPDAAGDSFQKLMAYLKSQFEAQNPGITLNPVMSLSCPYCNTYDANVQQQIFTSKTPVILNAVELDTIVLGDL